MRVSFIGALVLILGGCSSDTEKKLHNDHFLALWESNISYATSEPLWLSHSAYDASTSLMLPMHYAFKYPERFKEDPRIQFKTLIEDSAVYVDFTTFNGTVTKAQYIYFMSQYLKLAAQQGDFNWQVIEQLQAELLEAWLYEDAFHWDKSLELEGVRGRLLWNLSGPETRFSFYRAVIDQDWFTLSALNDLAYIYQLANLPIPFDNTELQEISKLILSQFGEFDGQAWYFQRGTWHDHRDYAYVGHAEIVDDMEPKPIANIGIDSSHQHRMPLWLKSFADNNLLEADFYQTLMTGFRYAYENNALVSIDSEQEYLLLQNNFITGENGVYRYNYVTQGEGNGYEAYQLSGTLYSGYYAFMDSSKYQIAMGKMSQQYPLSEKALSYYLGPGTSREQHPLFIPYNYFNNGFAELFSRVALCYDAELNECDLL